MSGANPFNQQFNDQFGPTPQPPTGPYPTAPLPIYSVEDICNQALRRISYPIPIGYIFEGSPAARVAVEVYSQTRDNLLRNSDWDFARRAVPLALLKTAPAGGYGYNTPWTQNYPPPPWAYEYAYPNDCLMIRSVRPTPVIMPEYDPQPNIFIVANDASSSVGGLAIGQGAIDNPQRMKVILTNLENALAVYTARVITPTEWNYSFTEALIAALATRFQAALAPSPDMDKERIQEELQAAGMAAGRRG